MSVSYGSQNDCRVTGKSSASRSARGFTLVEVLVAMTILAVGVSALVAASGASAFRADYLRDREFARWVATNALTQLQVLPSWPEPGTTNTEAEMINTTWHVNTRTRKVSDPALRRVDIEVRREKEADAYIYSVTGFLGDPELRELQPAVEVPQIPGQDSEGVIPGEDPTNLIEGGGGVPATNTGTILDGGVPGADTDALPNGLNQSLIQ